MENSIASPNVINVSKQSLPDNVINVKQRANKVSAYGYNIKEVQAIAHKLADALNDKSSFLFFCKVGWNLPEAKIWGFLEQVQNTKNLRKTPAEYFTWLCKMEMAGQLKGQPE